MRRISGACGAAGLRGGRLTPLLDGSLKRAASAVCPAWGWLPLVEHHPLRLVIAAPGQAPGPAGPQLGGRSLQRLDQAQGLDRRQLGGAEGPAGGLVPARIDQRPAPGAPRGLREQGL